MSALKQADLISVNDYLAGELVSPVKHEYLGGVVYAMAGARIRHNRIATRVLSILSTALRGRPCEPLNSDMKIRVRLMNHVRFYYPDASVVCQSNGPDETFQDSPVMVCEVLSRFPSHRRG